MLTHFAYTLGRIMIKIDFQDPPNCQTLPRALGDASVTRNTYQAASALHEVGAWAVGEQRIAA